MMWKPVKFLRLRQLLNWHRLSYLLIILVVAACSNESSRGPLIVESPDFQQVVEYTNAITITFNIYRSSGDSEPMYRCPFYWAEGTKLIPGNCPSIPTGVYVYQLEYWEKSNNQLLAKAEGSVDIDKTQGAVIQPILFFNFDEDQDGKNNLDDFLCRMTPNTAPTAKASSDLTGEVGNEVKLNGGNSSDIDCNNPALKYLWTLTRPENSSASLSNSETIQPSFTPDVTGNYEISLVVNDGEVSSKISRVTITVTEPPNPKPIANAGIDQKAQVGDNITLDGSDSSDADDHSLTYQWAVPPGFSSENSSTVKPTLTIPTNTVAGTLTFSLVVEDTKGEKSDPDTVQITIINSVPVAHAGADQNAEVSDSIILDARGSRDPNGDNLSYSWTSPEGIILSDAQVAQPSFTLANGSKVGTLSFSVTVNDGHGGTAIDNVDILVC